MGAVKQKGGAVTLKIQYFGEKSLESSMKSVSKGGAAAPTSSVVDPPLLRTTIDTNQTEIIRFGSTELSKSRFGFGSVRFRSL